MSTAPSTASKRFLGRFLRNAGAYFRLARRTPNPLGGGIGDAERHGFAIVLRMSACYAGACSKVHCLFDIKEAILLHNLIIQILKRLGLLFNGSSSGTSSAVALTSSGE